jgi:hypothetical protein
MSKSDVSDEEIRRRANLKAAKANKQKFDAAIAMMDLTSNRKAEQAKTARLRAFRLAKEAADAGLKRETQNARPKKAPRKRASSLS